MKHFKCDDVGEVKDYIGCKVICDHEKREIELSQPVLVQSLFDEIDDISQGKLYLPYSKPGIVLTKGNSMKKCDNVKHSRYRSGVGKLMYLAELS